MPTSSSPTHPLTVHASQELRDDAPLHLALGVLALGRDGVNLVDEQDARRLFLGVTRSR